MLTRPGPYHVKLRQCKWLGPTGFWGEMAKESGRWGPNQSDPDFIYINIVMCCCSARSSSQ